MNYIKSILLFAFVLSCEISADNTESVIVDELIKTSFSWDNSALPNYPTGTPEITILRIKIPPQTKLSVHEHPVINAGVLLEGELTVITEANDTLHLLAGDPIVEVVNKWHYGVNEGNKTAEIIVFYAGICDTPITIIKK